ncbi:MAG TPA: DUF6600 domain-containing protein [Terriglobales bacterium]
MRTAKVFVVAMVLATMVFLVAPRSWAQDSDPPGRVARINFVQGSVSFQPGGEGDWVTAVPNRPLTTGDNLWADRDSRSELHIGSSALRMNSETSLSFLNLDDRNVQLRLSLGSLIVQVRHLDDDDVFEVDTPNLALSLLRTGEYRIDVNGDGNQTVVTVWRGRGEVTGGGSSYTVVGGQQARFSGTDRLGYDIEEIPGNDDFDSWAFERDRREERSESANYVSQDLTGYEDLDDYGHWRYVGDYGPVWAPAAVPVGWAPYRFGHWVWISPWGWTWVEDEPWGFAPFHYGRWAFIESGWCWVPGPVFVRPVYAPALVAFVGGGGVGVAWFPLAPGEVYVPGYRASRTYVNNVNVTNTVVNVTRVTNVYNTTINNTNVNRITYINQQRPNAVTAVSRETFANARPVARNLAQVNEKELVSAPVTHQPAVQPVRASVLGAGAPARVRPPAAVMNRQVVARRSPAAPVPAFEQRQNSVNPRGGEASTSTLREPTPRQPEIPRPGDSRAAPRPAVPRPGQPQGARMNSRVEGPARATEPVRQEARPQEPSGREESGQGSPRAETWSHPLARPAPPVEEKSPAQMREEENKFNGWQQQHQRGQPAPEPRREEPRREERKNQ